MKGRRRTPWFIRRRTLPPLAEWSHRHGNDVDLHLTGPAGGNWTSGANGPRIELEAIEFCRVVSKRPGAVPLDALMSTEVPF